MRDPIIVTGMWHSGTRMLVEILREAGVSFGQEGVAYAPITRDFSDVSFSHFCLGLFLRSPNAMIPSTEESAFVHRTLETYIKTDGPWGFKLPVLAYVSPYFLRLYPNATIVGVVRDGRDVALSELGIGVPTGLPRVSDLGWRRWLRFYGLSRVWRYPPDAIYASRHAWTHFRRVKQQCLVGNTTATGYAGVAFDDIPFLASKSPPRPHVFAAQQWVESTSHLLALRGHGQFLEISYEALCQEPKRIIELLVEQLELVRADVSTIARIPSTARIGKWRSADPRVVEEITATANPLLQRLGYV